MEAPHLYGLDDSFIAQQAGAPVVHRQLLPALSDLQNQAFAAGFKLKVVSGYRSFDRQLLIWNAKAEGKRPVLDTDGRPLDMAQLDPWQQVQAILRWSALPGASRHHWGTDIDVYDAGAVAEDYQVNLTRDEVENNGPFAPMHEWLDQQIQSNTAFDFFRPYQFDIGGIAPERWHLSYAPIASEYQAAWNMDALIEQLSLKPLALKSIVIKHIDEIVERYVHVSPALYPAVFQGQVGLV